MTGPLSPSARGSARAAPAGRGASATTCARRRTSALARRAAAPHRRSSRSVGRWACPRGGCSYRGFPRLRLGSARGSCLAPLELVRQIPPRLALAIGDADDLAVGFHFPALPLDQGRE